MITVISPKNGAVVPQLTEKHKRYLDGASEAERVSYDDSLPLPVTVEFQPPTSGKVILTRASDGHTETFCAKDGKAELFGLRVGESYSVCVSVGLMTSEPRAFTTEAQAPRLLYVDGISNVRDVGGYVTTDERLIRQDLLFRSSELDCHFNITNEGRRTLTERLGIRTDIDLRGINGEKAESVLDGVRHTVFPLAAYGDIFTPTQKELYRQIFVLLSHRATYPALLHCWSGTDRTGTLCYVLGALLGIDEGELELDYEMSSFSVCGERSVSGDPFKEFKKRFYAYGSSARSAAEGFLADCGVSKDTIDKIRKIFIA